jgi:hypothetical protein
MWTPLIAGVGNVRELTSRSAGQPVPVLLFHGVEDGLLGGIA